MEKIELDEDTVDRIVELFVVSAVRKRLNEVKVGDEVNPL